MSKKVVITGNSRGTGLGRAAEFLKWDHPEYDLNMTYGTSFCDLSPAIVNVATG